MEKDNIETHRAHVEAVLEPITPRSRYDYVEIEQGSISFVQPFVRTQKFIARSIRNCARFVRTFWMHCVLFLVMIIIAEFALRAFEPRLMGRVYNSSLTGGYPIAMNAQGFRGDQVLVPKPPNIQRIIALGDSVTMGTGVAANSTWSARLEDRLNTPERTVEVLNGGLPALDLDQIELELRTRWMQFQPDSLVLVLSGNMISFAKARADRGEIEAPDPKKRQETVVVNESGFKSKLKKLYIDTAIPNALVVGTEHLKYAIGIADHRYNPEHPVGVMPAHGYIQDGSGTALTDEAYQRTRDQLAKLKSTADEMRLPLLVSYAPPRFYLDDDFGSNLKFVDRERFTVDPINRIRSICAELGIDFIDPRDEIRRAEPPVYIISDYTHLSPSGHDALASAIEKLLTSR